MNEGKVYRKQKWTNDRGFACPKQNIQPPDVNLTSHPPTKQDSCCLLSFFSVCLCVWLMHLCMNTYMRTLIDPLVLLPTVVCYSRLGWGGNLTDLRTRGRSTPHILTFGEEVSRSHVGRGSAVTTQWMTRQMSGCVSASYLQWPSPVSCPLTLDLWRLTVCLLLPPPGVYWCGDDGDTVPDEEVAVGRRGHSRLMTSHGTSLANTPLLG